MSFLKKLVLFYVTIAMAVLTTFTNFDPYRYIPSTVHSDVANADFDAFTTDLFASFLSDDTISLHAYVSHPESFHIENGTPTLGRNVIAERDTDNDAELQAALDRLKTFSYESLTENQQKAYDQVKSALEVSLEGSEFYLYNTSLNPITGIHLQLPILLADYEFSSASDVETYLALLADVDDYFSNIIDYENLRASHGLGLTDETIDQIITECDSTIASLTTGVLATTFTDRISELTGGTSSGAADASLSQAQADAYTARNRELLVGDVQRGYQILRDGLAALKGKRTAAGGLANLPDGKRYYQHLIDSDLGWNKSIDDIDDMLDARLKKDLAFILAYRETYGSSYRTGDSSTYRESDSSSTQARDASLSLNSSSDVTYNPEDPLSSARDTIEYLKSRSSADFPDAPETKYTVEAVPSELQDFTSPAYYMIPQVDSTEANHIYIATDKVKEDSFFTTLAHEGVPGHMYQTNWVLSQDNAPLRLILESTGYSEGWATYAEYASYAYTDETDASLTRAYDELNLLFGAKIDIGVNYKGWDQRQTYQYLATYLNIDYEDTTEMYQRAVDIPAYYAPYCFGWLAFESLRSQAQTDLGSAFNLKDFHQWLMDMGPLPFYNLEKRLTHYIKDRKYNNFVSFKKKARKERVQAMPEPVLRISI